MIEIVRKVNTLHNMAYMVPSPYVTSPILPHSLLRFKIKLYHNARLATLYILLTLYVINISQLIGR